MVKPRNLWIALADGGHARFLSVDYNHKLHIEESIDATTVHSRSSALGSDRPGRVFESASSARHAVAARHDPHEAEMFKFLHLVGEILNGASKRGAFERLILIAPAPALAELRTSLDPATAAKVVGTLAKDLVHMSNPEIATHLEALIGPAPGKS